MFDLKLGFKCNNNCIHCVVANKRSAGMLSLEEIEKIILKVPQGEEIQLTGGEPSIHPQLKDILEICNANNHPVVIQTNGTGFSDSNLLESCGPYINHIHIAIHSSYPQIHDEIVQQKGMWERTIQAFKNLIDYQREKKSSLCITTQTVLSKKNIPTLYDTFTFIQKMLPGTYMSMTFPHIMGNAWNNRKSIIFRYSEYKDEIQKTLKAYKDHIFTEAIPPCYLYPYHREVCTAEKDLMMDFLSGQHTRIGVDFSDFMGEKDYCLLDLESHKKAPLCLKCDLYNECVGVWEEYIDLFKDKLDLYPIREERKNENSI